MPSFEIPDGPTTIDAPRSGNSKSPQPAEASATYSVTNTTSESVVGRLGVKVSGASKEEWFTIDGDRERTFDPGETQTATVKARLPPEAAEGNYPFRLRAVAVNDPDNDHAEGPATMVKLGPGGGGPPSRLWLWILLGVLALVAIGGALFYMLRDKPKAPVEETTPVANASDTKQPTQFEQAEKQAIDWIDALNARDVEALVRLADPPYMAGEHTILQSESQIRDAFTRAFPVDRPDEKIVIQNVTSQPISKVIEGSGDNGLLRTLNLGGDDIFVTVETPRGKFLFLFRRSLQGVELAGVVDDRPPPQKIDVNAEPSPIEVNIEVNH